MSNEQNHAQGPELEVDEETGEVYDQTEDGEQEAAQDSLLEQILAATDLRTAKQQLEWKEIEEVAKGESLKIGMHGWFVRVPQKTVEKNGRRQVVKGSYLLGQVVASGEAKNKFGTVQPYVIVKGKNTTPSYRNKQGNLVPAINAVEGRWMVGIDSTLLEIPAHVGDVVELEFQRAGQGGQRNTWAKVNCWPTPR